MSLAAALHAVVAVLRRRPSDLLPVYALAAAAPAVARLGSLLGLGAAVVYLRTTGRLAPVVTDLASRDLDPPDPEAEPEAFSAWVEGVAPAFETVVTPAVLALVVAGFLLTLVALVVLGALVAAGRIGACGGRLRGDRGLTAGIGAVRERWLSVLAVFLLEGAVWAVASAVALLAAAAAAAVAPVLGVLIGAFAFLAWLLVVLAARALFAFAPVAVVLDGVGAIASLRRAGGFIRRNPVEAGGYYLIAVGALVAYSVAVGVLSLVEASSALSPVALLLLLPALDLLKTGLYADYRGRLDPPAAPTASVRTQVAVGARRGLRELAAFVRGHPGVHVLAVAIGLGGVAAGWTAAGPFVGALDASIVERLADHVPPAAALAYFGNNLTVGIATAMSGVAFAVPAAVSVWLNGAALGALARLEVDPHALVAFVAPHGTFEIPALVVSGALGLHLGVAFWRAWPGGAGRSYLADELERAFWVLVGVGLLLGVAALLEGFVSPYYWRPFV